MGCRAEAENQGRGGGGPNKTHPPHAPAALPARAPIARTVVAMTGAGAACRRSVDAGDYLCNLTLWATLRSPAPVAAFLHIPKPGPRATLPRMADGVTAAILTLAREARLQRTA